MPSSIDLATTAGRRAWVGALLVPMDEVRWEAFARALFAWQVGRVPAYRRLCAAHGISLETLKSWREIPAVPQQLFKREKLFSHGAKKPGAIYETSGTTTGQPGRQHLLSTDIYRAVSVEGAGCAGLFNGRAEFYFLAPSPAEAPHSSLSAMFGFWQKASGQTGQRFAVRRGRFDLAPLRGTLTERMKAGCPVAICGPAFGFVHLIDAWATMPPLLFPRGSWLLETGGFKGRSREISKAELYVQLAKTFSVPDSSIWNEYGMSELSSQAYARGTNGLHQTPPWARVLIIDPATGREVGVRKQGLVRWIDLANVDSVLAVQTLDVAERTEQGFRLIGRLPRTEPRGCSLSVEDLMAGGTRSRAFADDREIVPPMHPASRRNPGRNS